MDGKGRWVDNVVIEDGSAASRTEHTLKIPYT